MMNPFYSIIYLKPETASEEKISIGMFMNTGSNFMFDYSEEKLKVSSKLIDESVIASIEKTLKNIKRKITKKSNAHQVEAFEKSPFSYSYFEYLNKYSNNILVYSKPSENMGEFYLDDFDDMFRLFVDKHYKIYKTKHQSFKETIRKRLDNSLIANKIDISYRIPHRKIKTIYMSHEVDYIGVNGSIISGNNIDTKSDTYTLSHKIYLLRALVNGLINLSESLNMTNEGNHIIYYNEPDGVKQKKILHDLINDSTTHFSLKHWDEFEEDEKWISSNPITKFSDLLNRAVEGK